MSADSDNLSLQVEQKAVSKADYLAMKAKYILAKTKSAENFLQNSPINHGDIQSTWVRLIQVFTNVWANFRQGLSTLKASDKDNPNAFFNKMMHGTKYIVTKAGGVIYTGITAVGDFVISTLILSLVIGTLVGLYQKWHASKLLSQERLLKSKLAVAKTKAAKDKLEAELKFIHDKRREKELGIVQANQHYALQAKERHHGMFRFRRLKFVRRDENFTDAEIQKAAADIAAEEAMASDKTVGGKRKVTRLHWVIDAANTKVVSVLSSIWNWNVNQSMVYWLAWFVALCAVGFTAALTGAALITVNVITIGVGALLSLGKLAHRIVTYRARRNLEKHIDELLRYPVRGTKDNPPFTYGKKFSIADSDMLRKIAAAHLEKNEADELVSPYANKGRKDIDKAELKGVISKIAAHFNKVKANDKAARKAERVQYIQREFINFEGEQYEAQFDIAADKNFQANKTVTKQRSGFLTAQLYDYLKIERDPENENHHFKSRRLHRSGLVGFRQGFVFGFVIPFFIISMIGAFLLFPVLGPAIVAIGSFLLNAPAAVYIMTACGFAAGAVLGVHKFASARQAKNDHAFKAEHVLKAQYKDTGLSREAAFIERKAALDNLINGFSEEEKADIINKGGADLLNKDSVYNYDYFEKQRTKKSAWTNFKNVGGYIYEFFCGTQTGVLMTRFLFLSAMVLSGVIVAGVAAFSFGAPVIFFAIAAAMAVLLGSLRVIDIHQNRKIARRDGFLNNIDVRIEFLERNFSLVSGLMQKLRGSEPAPSSTDDPAPVVFSTDIPEPELIARSASAPQSGEAEQAEAREYSSSSKSLIETLNTSVDIEPVVGTDAESIAVKPAATLPRINIEVVNVSGNKASLYAVQKTCAQEASPALENTSSNTPAAPAA